MLKKVLILTAVASLSACSVLQPKTTEEQVTVRAEQRMAALKALNFEKAYGYMSPGYRQTKSMEVFRADFAGSVNMLSYEVLRTECPEEDVCSVVIKTEYAISAFGGGNRYSKEQRFVIDPVTTQKWIYTDGKWWYVKAD